MTSSAVDYVHRQVQQRFFAEALYFGALALPHARSAELHLHLGLACCGSIGGVADAQRILHGTPDVAVGGRPLVGNATRLVYEGFYHLLEAARGGARVPEDLAGIGADILVDLEWYQREDLKGFSLAGRKHTLRSAAAGAAVLLRRLLPNATPPSDEGRTRWAEELVDEELRQASGDAEFYRS